MKSKKVEQNIEKLEQFFKRFGSLPFDDDSSKIYGKIRANLEKSGNIIGPNDLLIASIALANDMTLVTNNIGEFERVEGLKIVDWK
jgi:tRNA(fMet)-specific endonuclease VapC